MSGKISKTSRLLKILNLQPDKNINQGELKSDAIPKPPRPMPTEKIIFNALEPLLGHVNNKENVHTHQSSRESDYFKKNMKADKKKKHCSHCKSVNNERMKTGNHMVTRVTGDTYNINGPNKIGGINIFRTTASNAMPTTSSSEPPRRTSNTNQMKKCVSIELLMSAHIKLDIPYTHYISDNLNLQWRRFFENIGYSAGEIDTALENNKVHGINETRYRLLLDWINNQSNNTLGRMASLLWKHGQKQVVKGLAKLYVNELQTK